MSDKPPPKRTSSDGHTAVQAYREKLESIQDGTLETLRDLNRKLDEEIESRPKKDPRRDGDSDPPIDVLVESGRTTVPAPPEEKKS